MAFRTQKKNCGICGEKRPICHPNLLAVKTKFSSTTVAQLLERFAERELSDLGTELEQSGTCKDCYTKLNDYDAAYTKALIIQQELTDLLQNSGLRIFDEEQILAEEVEAENVEMKWEQMEEIEQPDDTNPTKLISIESLQAVQFCMELNVCGEGFGNISDAQWHTHDEESDDEQLDAPVKESGNPSPMLVIEAIEQPEQILVNEGLAACDGTISTTYTEGENDPRCIKTEVNDGKESADEIFSVKDKESLKEHIEESHPIVEGYVCKVCGMTVQTRAALQSHYEKHRPESELTCTVCGFTARTRAALASHYGKHRREPELTCTVCSKKFSQKASLQRHMAIHTGEKAYQCDQCGKQYIHYSSFYMHQLAHKDVRNKKCTICGYSLPSNSHLKRHMRTHSGERPFACPVCGQLFSQRYNMVQHLNAHNGAPKRSIKVLECPYCDRTCDRKTQLKKHLEKCHPDKPVDP